MLAAVLVALAFSPADSTDTPATTQPTGVGSQPALGGVRAQAGQLLTGDVRAFRRRLADLRGTPVVVNQWASWCGPCRVEFPFFREEAERLTGRVAFLGVNSQDVRANAVEFLDEEPVPFPHYFDPDSRIARSFKGGRSWPTTAFYDAQGRLAFTHQGAYPDRQALADDIRRYAITGE